MLYLGITLLVIANGIANAQDCSKPIGEVCDPPFHGIDDWPETVEEFKKLCDKVYEALECGIGYEEECRKDSSALQTAYEIRDMVTEVCSDLSVLNAAIIDNYDCAYKALEPPILACPLPNDEEMERQAEALLDVSPNDGIPYDCMKMVNAQACEAMLIEKKCGNTAMRAFLEVVSKTPVPSCRYERNELLPLILRIRRFEEETGETILKRKK